MTDPTLDHLRARASNAPASIQRAVAKATPFVLANLRALAQPTRWVCSGIGASEGVARATVSWLQREAGVSARFLSFSEWHMDGCGASDDGVIVFSQGLCPNAHIAIERAPQHATKVLVTAATESAAAARASALGWLLCEHERTDEGSLLVRVDGPLCAMALARGLVESLAMTRNTAGLSRASLDAARAFQEGTLVGHSVATQHSVSSLDSVCAMIGAGSTLATHSGLAWAWMEATLSAPIALWDALAFAHGPLQALYDKRATILAFERDRGEERAVFDRLEGVLDRERHTLIRLRVARRDESAVFAHAGATWALLLTLLAERARDLQSWPGKGRDRALYEFDGR